MQYLTFFKLGSWSLSFSVLTLMLFGLSFELLQTASSCSALGENCYDYQILFAELVNIVWAIIYYFYLLRQEKNGLRLPVSRAKRIGQAVVAWMIYQLLSAFALLG